MTGRGGDGVVVEWLSDAPEDPPDPRRRPSRALVAGAGGLAAGIAITAAVALIAARGGPAGVPTSTDARIAASPTLPGSIVVATRGAPLPGAPLLGEPTDLTAYVLVEDEGGRWVARVALDTGEVTPLDVPVPLDGGGRFLPMGPGQVLLDTPSDAVWVTGTGPHLLGPIGSFAALGEQHLLFVGSDGRLMVWLDRTTGRSRAEEVPEANSVRVADSDGSLLAYVHPGGTYRVHPGPPELVDPGRVLAAGPSGRVVHRCDPDLACEVRWVSGTEQVVLTRVAPQDWVDAVLAPGGERVALVHHSGDGPEVVVVDRTTGAAVSHPLPGGAPPGFGDAPSWSPDARWLVLPGSGELTVLETLGGKVLSLPWPGGARVLAAAIT